MDSGDRMNYYQNPRLTGWRGSIARAHRAWCASVARARREQAKRAILMAERNALALATKEKKR